MERRPKPPVSLASHRDVEQEPVPKEVIGALDHLIDRGRLSYEQASEMLAHYAMNGYGLFPLEEDPPVVQPVNLDQLELF